MRNNRGITLVALVITIILMIILATTSVNLILGPDGIINRSRESGDTYKNSQGAENKELIGGEDYLNMLSTNIDAGGYREYN